MSYRRYSRDSGRRFGRDDYSFQEELRELANDPEVTGRDVLALILEHCDPQQAAEIAEAARELGEDRRGPSAWARDAVERRRLGRDVLRPRAARRFGRDDMEPRGYERVDEARPIERFVRERDEGQDRRYAGAGDMAMDAFNEMFPNAGPIDR